MVLCRMCKRPVVNKRVDARYCSTICKSGALGLRRRQDSLERIASEERILEIWAPQILQLERAIVGQAPKEAGGYRIGFWSGEPLNAHMWLPFFFKDAKKRRMLSGRYSYQDFFQLCPFEAPAAPAPGRYLIHYVTARYPHSVIEAKEPVEVEIPFSVRVPNLMIDPRALRL